LADGFIGVGCPGPVCGDDAVRGAGRVSGVATEVEFSSVPA